MELIIRIEEPVLCQRPIIEQKSSVDLDPDDSSLHLSSRHHRLWTSTNEL